MSPVRNQPSSVKRSLAVVAVVVAGRHPRPAHLELAHRLAVPGHEPVFVARADLDERRRPALLGALLVDQRRRPRPRARRGTWLTVPIGVVSVMPQAWTMRRPWRFSKASISGLRHRRPADKHRAHRREVVHARVRVEILQDAHPDRRHAGRERHAFANEQIDEARRIEVRTGQHELRAHHHGRVRQAPGVGVEHRDDRQHGVGLVDAHAGRQGDGERVQHERPVRIEHALRLSCRAGRVAHRRGRCARPDRRSLRAGRHLRAGLRTRDTRAGRPSSAPTTIARATRVRGATCSHSGSSVSSTSTTRSSASLTMKASSSGWSRRLSVCSTAPIERDAEVRLEVLEVVPAERGDAIALADAEAGAARRPGAGRAPRSPPYVYRWSEPSARRVTMSRRACTGSAWRKIAASVSGKSIIRPFTDGIVVSGVSAKESSRVSSWHFRVTRNVSRTCIHMHPRATRDGKVIGLSLAAP